MKSAEGHDIGFKHEIDEAKAAVVRRVFQLYLDGYSLSGIAKLLCQDGVPTPRAATKHRRKGWVDGTIRVFLHNEKYAGIWRFKQREWVHVPGEDRRTPRMRPASEVMVQERPHLRIIDEDTWKAVQARLAAVRNQYTRTEDGRPKGKAISGKATNWLLSGILHCGRCGAVMIIYGGSSSKYYRCIDNVKRGTCSNDLSVKESIARTCILDGLRERLLSPEGTARARKRLAERLGELSRLANAELGERQGRLARTTSRIARLVTFIADGDHSDAVVSALRDLEEQAKVEKAAIAEIEQRAAAPIRLPSPADIEQLAFNLSGRLAQDPVRGREELRRLLNDGKIICDPQPGRFYIARADLLPMVLLIGAQKVERPLGESQGACSKLSSGGRI